MIWRRLIGSLGLGEDLSSPLLDKAVIEDLWKMLLATQMALHVTSPNSNGD